ncbi:hypothetical protein GCU67_20975 [Modestobacter muralis]|uniref:Uncharacterized protein n=1 Tax=Modestobacter muralis TaxID=1608614 RepID=A0A6P0F0A9_9ACTN|nr:hypothetical protein [Modestobacter muralis]NEK96620.1 hypothetical protein [Modestobacter muralis]
MPLVAFGVIALSGRPSARQVCQGRQRRMHVHEVREAHDAAVLLIQGRAAEDLPVAVLVMVDVFDWCTIEYRLGGEDAGVW